MNVERLYEIVTYLRQMDSQTGIQSRLTELRDHLSNLASQPQNQTHQSNVVSALNNLEIAFANFQEKTTPAQEALVREINGERFFSAALPQEIRRDLSQNAITPAAVSGEVNRLTSERQAYLSKLENVEQGLVALGVKGEDPNPGDVELGILVPRSLFENNLGSLAKELGVVNRIIQIFTEVTTGQAHPTEVREISTSDPVFFLSAPVVAVLAIGKVVDWLTNKWKEIEEIRKLRAETRKLGIEAAIKPIDEKIQSTIEASVQEQKNDLIKSYEGDRNRRNELESGLQWALESLIARIERGLTVEVRILAPPQEAIGDDGAAETKMYADIAALSHKLQFVQICQEQPILPLPPSDPPEPQPAHVARAAKSTK